MHLFRVRNLFLYILLVLVFWRTLTNIYVGKSLHLEPKFQSSSTEFILAFSFPYFTPFLQFSLIYLIIWSVPFYVANLPKQPGSHWLRCPPHPRPASAGLPSHPAPLPSSCMAQAATGLSDIPKTFTVIHLFLKYLSSTYYVAGVFPGGRHEIGRQTKFPPLTELRFQWGRIDNKQMNKYIRW